MTATDPLVLIAGGALSRSSYGGHLAVFRQYVAGFAELGYRVVFVDELQDDVEHGLTSRIVQLTGCPEVAVLGPPDAPAAERTHDFVVEVARKANLLINVMGYLTDEEILAAPRRRVFLDIDPGFGQMWKALGLADVFAGHDAYVTVGTMLPQSKVPNCGIDWIPTLPPVYLPDWPVAPPAPQSPVTSVVTWRGPFGPIEYEGTTYGLRVHEFRRFFRLPERTTEHFELALDIDPADERDRQALLDHGWALVDPRAVAGSLEAYRDYISRSKAEFMVAKNLYVATQAGWFSDRSACYLATGRPVIAQDTGFSKVLPTGNGLLTFNTLDEAEAAIEDLNARYLEHCEAARWLAEEYFSADVVLPKLLDAAL